MDDEIFYIFSVKTSGWWGQSGTYVSDISKAREFTEAKAIEFCRSRYTPGQDSSVGAIPVSKKLIEVIQKP